MSGIPRYIRYCWRYILRHEKWGVGYLCYPDTRRSRYRFPSALGDLGKRSHTIDGTAVYRGRCFGLGVVNIYDGHSPKALHELCD